MCERPILFSGEMVRAILDGRKTQTRRIVNPQPPPWAERATHAADGWGRDRKHKWCFNDEAAFEAFTCNCAHGEPGDRLWVKETFQTGEFAQNEPRGYVYRATDPDWESTPDWKWKPSIFMPREASRITLELTAVRAERLQDISEADAKAEGVTPNWTDKIRADSCRDDANRAHSIAFGEIWASINGLDSWEANPWVWVETFKKVFNSDYPTGNG